jgi:hypothetical protein
LGPELGARAQTDVTESRAAGGLKGFAAHGRVITLLIESDRYIVVQRAATSETVRAEPFDAIELRVAVLFGDDEDD